ncbi:unnamed protein product [Pleuronectes platessa]|uniref:Uncharacterized protein n=1 Tax=Pleuronectes platessa TaxID=8262 RepID=A0A9N7ZG61_PLEPL|nr:unnamed protein product [Pleuronectes platessa]
MVAVPPSGHILPSPHCCMNLGSQPVPASLEARALYAHGHTAPPPLHSHTALQPLGEKNKDGGEVVRSLFSKTSTAKQQFSSSGPSSNGTVPQVQILRRYQRRRLRLRLLAAGRTLSSNKSADKQIFFINFPLIEAEETPPAAARLQSGNDRNNKLEASSEETVRIGLTEFLISEEDRSVGTKLTGCVRVRLHTHVEERGLLSAPMCYSVIYAARLLQESACLRLK